MVGKRRDTAVTAMNAIVAQVPIPDVDLPSVDAAAQVLWALRASFRSPQVRVAETCYEFIAVVTTG